MSVQRVAPNHRHTACSCAGEPGSRGGRAAFGQALEHALPPAGTAAPTGATAPGKLELHGSWKLEGSPRHDAHHRTHHHSEATPAAL